MKKLLAVLLCLCMAVAVVACGATEKEYTLGMGVVVSTASSTTGTAQVDATVAAVVTDADGKIVACSIDVAQNKMTVADGAVDTSKVFQTKAELGDAYGMAASPYSPDNNGDGVVKEWYEQAKAFEDYVIGKTATEVAAMTTKEVNGHQISTDDALLSAGCTIQIGDFRDAVVKACNDDQAMTFTTSAKFTLGVGADTTAAESVAATDSENGTVAMYTDFAAAVVSDGKVLAALNDAIQPKITIDTAGEIVSTSFGGTKRELKEGYNMATYGASLDMNGDGKVYEWYVQSEAFSKYVVGKTAAEISAIETAANAHGYMMATDTALLDAGCTIQITSMKAVMAEAVNNAK